jgi:type II secretory ATPase GspE/PulE/Tfp pilus assembly ATPase PilB-like protein
LQITLFSSLRESGYKLVAQGITSLDEIERVVGAE